MQMKKKKKNRIGKLRWRRWPLFGFSRLRSVALGLALRLRPRLGSSAKGIPLCETKRETDSRRRCQRRSCCGQCCCRLVATPDVKCASNGIAERERERPRERERGRARASERLAAWPGASCKSLLCQCTRCLARPTQPSSPRCSAVSASAEQLVSLSHRCRCQRRRRRRLWSCSRALTAVLVGPVPEKLAFSRHATSAS